MHSFTHILSLLALSSAAASATNLLPALPLEAGMSLSKRVVQCKGDVYCPDGYFCMTGSNGVPGCCPNGKKCSGPGGIETIYTTFTTYVHTQTGVYTDAPETTTTSEPVYTTTTDTETETETSTSTDEDVYGSTTVAPESTEPVSTTLYTTTLYSNATTTGYKNVTTATITPEIQTGSAVVNAAAWNVGAVGIAAAVMALVV